MALDKLVDSTQLDSDLTSVADAIRAKSGGSSQLAFPAGFVSEIQAIPSGGGLPSPYKFVSGVLTPTSDSQQLTFPLPEFTEIPWYFICWVENYTSYAHLKRVIVKAESVRLKSVKEPNANPDDVKAIQEINASGNAENWTGGVTATYSSSGITIKTSRSTYFRATVPYSYVAFGV